MKFFSLSIIGLAAIALFSGCAVKTGATLPASSGALSGSAAVDAQGNCTGAFVSAYDNAVTQATLAQASPTAAQLQQLAAACADIATPISCHALVGTTPSDVSTTDLKAACSASTSKTSTVLSGSTSSVINAGAASGVSTGPATVIATIPPLIAIETDSNNGTCTASFTSGYMSVSNLLASLAATTTPLTPEQLAQASQTCSSFLSTISQAVSCTASNQVGGSNTLLSSSTLAAQCARYE